MDRSKPSTSGHDVLEMLFRHKWKALLIPTCVIGLGLAIALFLPRTYRSEAKLALQVGRQSVNIDPTAQTGQQMIAIQQQGREGEVITAMDLLRSRGVVAKVVDKLGADYVLRGGPPGEGEPSAVAKAVNATVGEAARWAITQLKSIDPISREEEAIIEIEENLAVDAERDSILILVSYSTDSAIGAQQVLSTLIDVYQDEHLRIHRNDGSRLFFQQQEELHRGEYDTAMGAVRDAKDEMGVASVEARRQNLEAQLQATTLSRFEAESARSAALSAVKDLERQLSDMPERLIASKTSIPNEGADLMREQLYALQVRQADLKARYSDTHPLVVAVTRQVEEAEQVVDGESSVREETVDDVNPIHRQLTLNLKLKQSELASLDGRLKALVEQEKGVRTELEKINTNAVRLARLERDESLASRKYYRYADNLEQARIDEELERQKISSINIAQDPTLAEKPVSPSKAIVALASMALAFAGTFASILGFEQLNDKPRSESSLEQATGVPVLASIPDSAVHGRVLAP
ncbi:Chain length determinant protein [Planctomycetes bacterium MalM25]|nr:Chain length determinant protein [Planctomycetes bacterium MalM25]